jgi:O-antigen/teichoic acid export membrane protein
MFTKIRKIDSFTKNIVFVFFGTSFANFLNLLYQLLIAHNLSPQDFASFNALLAFFMLISNPLSTFQTVVAKYASEYSARGDNSSTDILLQSLLRKGVFFSFLIFVAFLFISPYILASLKIDSMASGYILTILVAVSLFTPVLLGALQGLELFGWLVIYSLLNGIIKLVLTVVFLWLGLKIAGALGAFFISALFAFLIGILPLWGRLTARIDQHRAPNYKEIFLYVFPIALSNLCFIWLISFDMVLVKFFFSAEVAGVYSLAQMAGKIFLFLPGAISIVMFPRTSGLNAVSSDTKGVLRKSIIYAFCLCLSAALFYNIFPGVTLRILTGKALPESILIGRLFSFSMTFFALCFVLINYFLSLKSFGFIKYLVFSSLLQFIGIIVFHTTLFQVQLVLCFNSVFLFVALLLSLKREPKL